MNIVVKKREETGVSYKQIVDLMHEAFEERIQQGLNFSCSFITEEEFKRKTKNAVILVAIDEDAEEFVGFAVITVVTRRFMGTYAFVQDLSVSPKVKRCGIGTKLENACVSVAIKMKCKYMRCTTAVGAESSVKYHLKQGYKIIGLDSFPTTNYYSYVFRMCLAPSIWRSDLFCKIAYMLSYIKTHMTKKENGSLTRFGSILKVCHL